MNTQNTIEWIRRLRDGSNIIVEFQDGTRGGTSSASVAGLKALADEVERLQAKDHPAQFDPYAVWREIDDIIQQLEWCNYECEAGSLENNVAFQRLKQIVMQAFMRDD